ncbi:MAG TPA: LamG domain-containing protein [Chthoniobacteraceae bacterium]|nr:LamG domain-containing protein [Chthoniobacteraceae bacterium]
MLIPLLSAGAMAQTLILEYRFNETGTTAASTGTDTTGLGLYKNTSTLEDLHGGPGSGVSGAAGDRAFQNIRTEGPVTGGAARSASTVASINQLTSFTLTGWFHTGTASMIPSGARLISFDNATGGVSLWADGSGNLTLTIGGSYVTSTGAMYSATDSWQFFAVTYDGTLASNNVSFYVGTTAEESLSTPLLRSLDKGTVGTTDRALTLGNRVGNDRPFGGALDNIRIFGSKTDASGVLSASQIESYRAVDVIPEPASVAFVISGAVVLSLGMLRRFKH